MPTFKTIRIKKRGGGTRLQRVRVLASGKFRFVKNTSKRKTSRTRKVNPTRRRGVRRMARRKKRRGGKSIAQQAMKWIRIGALVAPAVNDIVTQDSMENKLRMLSQHYTGYDPVTGTFNFADLAAGWGPYLGAVLTTYGIPKIASIIRRL